MALHDVKEILDELERLYGNEARPASDFCYEEPLDDLILTILSQNTNDKLRDKAFANMKARYSSWEEVAHADIEELKDVLRIAGMSGTKPPRIQQILAAVKDKFGVYSIKELCGWTQPDVRAYLTEDLGHRRVLRPRPSGLPGRHAHHAPQQALRLGRGEAAAR